MEAVPRHRGRVNRRLLADGSLGVRLVASQANREYFFRTARRKNTTLYGVAEWQPLAALTLTAGMDLERRRSIPWINGLPLRGDGTFPERGLPQEPHLHPLLRAELGLQPPRQRLRELHRHL